MQSSYLVSSLQASRDAGHIGKIPVRNLWLLMLYASDLFRQRGGASIAVEDCPDDIPNLVAEILTRHVERRLRRNLTFGYQSREATPGRVRGRINLLQTESHRLLLRGKVACRFDELTVDTPRNRYVRAALETISGLVQDNSLAHRCRALAGSLRQMGVASELSHRAAGSIDQFGRHDADDRQMVAAARLAFELSLPTEMLGKHHLSLPDRDIHWIRKLFEKSVAGFYDVVLSEDGWRVYAGKTQSWLVEEKSPGIDKLLPGMRTDIVLDHVDTGRRIVIDTKFNAMVTPGWHSSETLRSNYVYQIYSYLMSQEGNGDPFSATASGLLLHPSVGVMYDEFAVIQSHEIRFATVDLAGDSQQIRSQLLRVIAPADPLCGE